MRPPVPQTLKPSPGELPAISRWKDTKEPPHAFLLFVMCLISARSPPSPRAACLTLQQEDVVTQTNLW